ncbi:MAG TPA: hypothetical protein VFS37_10640 [Conexibacter sp.]|nr:hypothetical protein [Conexibacter sp.]
MELSRRRFVGALAAAPVAYALASADEAAAKLGHGRHGYRLRPLAKTKVFDPSDGTGFGAVTSIGNFTDTSLVKRNGRWTLLGGAQHRATGRLGMYSASLPQGAPLSATGWKIDTVPGDPTTAAPLVPDPPGEAWDGLGGRHCLSYVRGWDPALNGGLGGWQERLYYVGANPSFGGPYSIGYVVWDGAQWTIPADVPQPVFAASESLGGSTGRFSGVYEPNVIYHDGKWRMWFVCGPPDAQNHMQHGYVESVDGRTNWTNKKVYWPAAADVFDNAVIRSPKRGWGHGHGGGHRHGHLGHRHGRGFEAVFSRFALSFQPRDDWGIWWHRADEPYDSPARWSEPVQLVQANDGSAWHSLGVWKPTIGYSDTQPGRAFVFFDGGFPFGRGAEYTTGCVECEVVPL